MHEISFSIANHQSSEIIQNLKTSVIHKNCLVCANDFQVDYFHIGRMCCSKACSNRLSTKYNKGKRKIIKCCKCNSDILVGITATLNNHYCINCKKIYYNVSEKGTVKKKKKCKICGQYKHPRPELCKKSQIISGLVKYFNFDKNKLGALEVYSEFDRIKNMLEIDYHENKLCLDEISKKYNHFHPGNFSKFLYSLGIKLRNIKEANFNSRAMNRIKPYITRTQYKHNWHINWEGNKVYYRSSYELDYAKELDEKKIKYDMEAFCIKYFDTKLKNFHHAYPDFYLSESNTLVEIKSWYTLDIQNMKDKVKAYKEAGYNFKLILEHDEFDIEKIKC